MKKFLIIVLLILSACKENTASPYLNYSSEECIVDEACVWDAFEHIAFGNEFSDDRKLNYISKWKRPVVIGLMGENKDKFKPLVEEHITMISNHINHPIKMWEAGDYTNIGIVFTDDFDKAIYQTYRKTFEDVYGRLAGDKEYLIKNYREIKKKQKNFNCFANLGLSSDHTIQIAVIFILDLKDKKNIWPCIQEEVTQSLGIRNDYIDSKHTSFNDLLLNRNLTPLDWLLLQILYHKDIKPGMSKDDVKQKFSSVYSQLTNEKHND